MQHEIDNAAEAYKLFSSNPAKVSLLAANEKVSEKLPSTVLAKNVAEKMQNRNDIIVEGPISIDLSLSKESAEIKKYKGKIQGDADIFIAPRIETGNALYKSLQYYIKAKMGGLVYGARCPVVLTSRADDNNTKFNSLLLGIVLWQRNSAEKSQQAQI
jgi:phosphate butyryltransferase